MNTDMRMYNLWMKSPVAAKADSVHSADRAANVFVPIEMARQGVDAEAISGVIPLRGVSYQLSPVFK